MTSVRTQLIEEYLQRLDSASAALEPQRRAELREEIREHIDAAVDEVETLDAAAVRAILGRLGSPEEIVSAEQGPAATVVIPPAPANAGPEPTGPQPPAPMTTGRPSRKPFALGAAATFLACAPALGWWAVQSSHPSGAMQQPSGPTATSTP